MQLPSRPKPLPALEDKVISNLNPLLSEYGVSVYQKEQPELYDVLPYWVGKDFPAR